MKAKVVKIGNSRGIRLPKTILEEVGLGEDVVLEASRGAIVIRPASKPRSGWVMLFKEMAERGDDRLLEPEPARVSWDKKEWQWK